jgi:hypothetical protein
MFNTLFLFFAQTRLFWKARNTFSRLSFFFYIRLFGIKHRMREGGTITKSLFSLLWSILGQLILALFITIGLQGINPYCVPLFTKIGFTIPEDSTYGTLLEVVIAVGGVFIGLYYAAISTIGGAIYARLPNDIRDLLAKEQVGNVYMRLLALFTSFGVCFLAFHTVGFEPIILAIPLLILGAAVMIIGFVRLGARAFYFFDPTILSHRLFKQLFQYHRQVQAGGYRWLDPSFQNCTRQRAQNTIDTLTAVSDIAGEEPYLNGRPFADMCKNLLVFLCDYERIKKSIPTGSLWYRQKYVHPDWYRTSHTKTSLAYETATGLQPETVSDLRWIESAILPIVRRCLEINMEEKRYPIVIELLSRLDLYMRLLAAEHQIEYAFDLIGEVFSWCEKFLFVEKSSIVIGKEESLEHMEICGQLATMPISVLLDYRHTIKSHGQQAIHQQIRRIKWRSKKSMYRVGFAVHVLPRLEWMRPRLEFERRIEGHVISPIWYLEELVNQKAAENHHTAMLCLYEKIGRFYKPWIESAISSKHPWLAAVILSRESEYWNKLDCHKDVLNQFWNDLNTERKAKKIPWPSLDIDELREKSRQRDKELLELMSKENILLPLISRPESHPDFAGQFLHTVGEALLRTMCENDCDTIEELFNGYFHGSLLQFKQLRSEETTSDWQYQSNFKVAAGPLLDLMAISGYAYLLSEYHDTSSIKTPIINAWDEYFDHDRGESRLQCLANAVSLSDSVFGVAPRDINRTRWQQMIDRQLENVERQEIPPDPMHQSPLVRIFARHPSYIRICDEIDIFIAKYAREREDGENLDFGGRRRDLREEIHREERRTTRNEES